MFKSQVEQRADGELFFHCQVLNNLWCHKECTHTDLAKIGVTLWKETVCDQPPLVFYRKSDTLFSKFHPLDVRYSSSIVPALERLLCVPHQLAISRNFVLCKPWHSAMQKELMKLQGGHRRPCGMRARMNQAFQQ